MRFDYYINQTETTKGHMSYIIGAKRVAQLERLAQDNFVWDDVVCKGEPFICTVVCLDVAERKERE